VDHSIQDVAAIASETSESSQEMNSQSESLRDAIDGLSRLVNGGHQSLHQRIIA
jgi:methyl-accepting chemotaxis protein